MLLTVVLSSPAFGQSADPARTTPNAAGGPVANSIGLCQCIADHTAMRTRCVAGTAACAAACASSIYSLMPLAQGALSVCPPNELYVVLPNADGRPGSGAIEVGSGPSSITLDQAFGAAAALPGGATGSVSVPPDVTQTIFSKAIAARPMLPRTFVLYFDSGSVRLNTDGAAEYRRAVANIKARPVHEVEVIGNTDTVADNAVNQKLSLERAAAIREALIRDGIAGRTIETTARGKINLAVPTGDNVSEQRNRRVEVVVR